MTTNSLNYPGIEWEKASPGEVGLNASKLKEANQRLNRRVEQYGDGRCRVVIIRAGRLVSEWNYGLESQTQVWMESATKSIFSCILGIAIEDGIIVSADLRLTDYYPEAMDVPNGTGPKSGRYVFSKDHHITLRQVISNTSGYMKPGEEPWKGYIHSHLGAR